MQENPFASPVTEAQIVEPPALGIGPTAAFYQLFATGVFTILCALAAWLIGSVGPGARVSFLFSVVGMVAGPILFLIYAKVAAALAEAGNKRGLKLMEAKNYSDAAASFQQSLEYYDEHPWLDENRHYVLMSSSARSFREKALYNLSLAYFQMGKHGEVARYAGRLVEDFPHSDLIPSCERMLEATASRSTAATP